MNLYTFSFIFYSMKKIAFVFSLLLVFVAFSNIAAAQTTSGTAMSPQIKPGRAMLNVPSLATEEQFLVLKSSVLDKIEGVSLSNWNPSSKQLILMYDLNKTGVDKVMAVLAQNGYSATIYVASDKPRTTEK